MHVRAFNLLSRLQLHRNSTFTDTAFLLRGSFFNGPGRPPRSTIGAAAIWFDSGKCQASRRCHWLLQLSSLTIINTWTASQQLHWLYTYRLHAASASPWEGWVAVASLPLLGVRDAVRPTFWDQDMFLWTFPSDISPWQSLLKVTNKDLLRITI